MDTFFCRESIHDRKLVLGSPTLVQKASRNKCQSRIASSFLTISIDTIENETKKKRYYNILLGKVISSGHNFTHL